MSNAFNYGDWQQGQQLASEQQQAGLSQTGGAYNPYTPATPGSIGPVNNAPPPGQTGNYITGYGAGGAPIYGGNTGAGNPGQADAYGFVQGQIQTPLESSPYDASINTAAGQVANYNNMASQAAMSISRTLACSTSSSISSQVLRTEISSMRSRS